MLLDLAYLPPIWRNSGLVSSHIKAPSTGASQITLCLQQRRENPSSVWLTGVKTLEVRGCECGFVDDAVRGLG